jgi:osmotically-inducible protein OsmY
MTTAQREEIERRLHQDAELHIYVSEDEGKIILTGIIADEEERETALDIVSAVAPGAFVEDNLELDEVMPPMLERSALTTEPRGSITETLLEGLREGESLEPGDFTDQETLQFGDSAAGPTSSFEDDPSGEGDEVFVPPTDPVGTDREVIGGLQATSMEDADVERSSDGLLGDEAIRDAVLRELREDAATTDLVLEVEVNEGMVVLRGQVGFIEDVESAEEVAARVPGVVDVDEQLDVRGL